jgi:hypothetical protein
MDELLKSFEFTSFSRYITENNMIKWFFVI